MENASKALMIAGEVLIALLVISLLVVFYNNIKDLRGTKETVDVTEQVAEYNKQYDVYYRNNLYGSDILSLANKIYDYNKTESEIEGYAKLEMQVTFKYGISANKEIIVSKKEVYSAQDLKEKAQYLENNIEKYGKEKISGNTVQALAGLRTSELKQILEIGIEESIPTTIQTKINNYLGYKSALSTLKSRRFKAESFEYDNKTGRITLMKFVEI